MIRIEELTLRRGIKVLLDKASVVLQPGEKVGLVGANGAGKTSLFALLLGQLHPDGGDFSMPNGWRISHVAQETEATSRSALEHVIDGDTQLRAVADEIAAIEEANHDHSDHRNDHYGEQLGHLHSRYADLDGYTVESRAETLLLGLGFTLEQTRQPVSSFSGGWRMRLNLAQALMCPSDLLLLDEPTNHLDLDAIVWLEQWLRRYPGTMIVISHDREFLDAVCNVTVHIDQAGLKRYGGNYTTFEKLRAVQSSMTAAAYAKQQREIEHLQSFVSRFKALASKAKQAQSRVKALERMDIISPTHASSPFTFHFRTPDAAPDPMLTAEDMVCGYASPQGDKVILSGINLSLRVGERIGLLGANGQGKSTLVKTLAGTQMPLAGTLRAGKGLAIGYFAQHQVDMLRLDESPLHQLARIAPNTREQELRNYLGGFDFGNEMATSKVAPFSGGEKARLALALIIWTKPNLLLLDEPTNHLDLETREALTIALAQFEGTLILVSHDRALLRATTDSFLLVSGGSVAPFDGDLDDYRDWLLGKSAVKAEPAGNKAAQPDVTRPAARLQAPLSEAERRSQRKREADSRNALAQQRKPLESRLKRIDDQLAKLSSRKQAVDAALADPQAYEESRKDALRKLVDDQAYLAKEIASLEAEWLEQQDALEKLAA